jgi:methyl-accepting chemotaxis protein
MSASSHKRTLGLDMKGPVQRTFILLEFTLLMFTMIYLLYLIFATMDSVLTSVAAEEQVLLESVIDRINFLLLVRISILFLVVFIVNVLLGLFYLHRLTGPLVRIKTVLLKISEGELPTRDVTLRKGDFPTDLSEALTKAILKIREWRNP